MVVVVKREVREKIEPRMIFLLEEMFGMPVLMDRLSRACAAASEVRREDNPMITADCRIWRSRLDWALEHHECSAHSLISVRRLERFSVCPRPFFTLPQPKHH